MPATEERTRQEIVGQGSRVRPGYSFSLARLCRLAKRQCSTGVEVCSVEDFHGRDREAIVFVLPLPENKPRDWKEERLQAKIAYVGASRPRLHLAVMCTSDEWKRLKNARHLHRLLIQEIHEKNGQGKRAASVLLTTHEAKEANGGKRQTDDEVEAKGREEGREVVERERQEDGAQAKG